MIDLGLENCNKWHNKFIFKTAISILLISNHNSFRVLFDKISFGIFFWIFTLIFLVLEMASLSGNQHCANCIDTLSSPIRHARQRHEVDRLLLPNCRSWTAVGKLHQFISDYLKGCDDRRTIAKFSKSIVWDKVPEKTTLVLEMPKLFPYNTPPFSAKSRQFGIDNLGPCLLDGSFPELP